MSILKKYTLPGPRYSTYPTIPYWEGEPLGAEEWETHIRNRQENTSDYGISLYIHLPFCEKLCAFCAYNARITTNHEVEKPYIEAVLTEWEKYKKILHPDTVIRELYIGGGTPTFFSPDHLRMLIEGVTRTFPLDEGAEVGFEAHPNNTEIKHLFTLRSMGFNSLSFGIQDFDPNVQMLIRRVQPFNKIKKVVHQARGLGYKSINFDLLYGLPAQNRKTVEETMYKTIDLSPDRVAYYNYAHIPELKPAQRIYENDLPTDEEKIMLYQYGRKILQENDYVEIGMDHFALPFEKIYDSAQRGRVGHNFMGYNTASAPVQIGLGMSAVSDTWTALAQNEMTVEAYTEAVNMPGFPFHKGHKMTTKDFEIRTHIYNLMCTFETNWGYDPSSPYWKEVSKRLEPFAEDGLVEQHYGSVKVSEKGKAVLRNVCMAFDERLWKSELKPELY